jgi:hypothetical protein
MSTKNRTEMSSKTEQALDKAHTAGHEAGAKESLPMGRRERMPAAEHGFSDHNKKGNTNLRGKNLKYATRRIK